MALLNIMWDQADSLISRKKAYLTYNDGSKAVIYRGIKIENTDGDIKVYSADSEFYKDITELFIMNDELDFVSSVHAFLRRKYLKHLDRIEEWMKKEMNGQKNHKKITNLKSLREKTLGKYNEINT